MRTKVFIFLPNNGIGGSQTQFIRLQKSLSHSFDIFLYSLRSHSHPSPNISHLSLLKFYLLCLIHRPKFLVACNCFQFICLTPLVPFFRIVLAERNCPSSSIKREGFFSKLIRYFSYRYSSSLSVQTTTSYRYVRRFIRKDVCLTPNLFQPTPLQPIAIPSSCSPIDILCVGTKPYPKGFDIVYDVYVSLTKLISRDISVTFVGVTSSQLLSLVPDLSARSYPIFFKSPQLSVNNLYSKYTFLFVASRFEGYPNVIDEALNASIPVVILSTPFLQYEFCSLPDSVLYCNCFDDLRSKLETFLSNYYSNVNQFSRSSKLFLKNKNLISLASWTSLLS